MAESTGAWAGEGCGARLANTRGCSPVSTVTAFPGRRGARRPPQVAQRSRGSADPGHPGSPPAAGQGPLFPQNAARERSRVQALRQAFLSLQAALPAVPPGTKLSKLDVLVLATSYIAHLSHELGRGPPPPAPSRPLYGHPLLHPLKKWPMRSRLYAGSCGVLGPDCSGTAAANSSQEHTGLGDSRGAAGDSSP